MKIPKLITLGTLPQSHKIEYFKIQWELKWTPNEVPIFKILPLSLKQDRDNDEKTS